MTERKEIIPAAELNTARFWVKRELEGRHLPFLPDLVEERLFTQGRTAWNYKYSDLEVDRRKESKKITFNVNVLLKKEFHRFVKQHRFIFKATCLFFPSRHELKVLDIQSLRVGP